MSYHFSRALVEEFSAACCSAGAAYAPSSSTTTQGGCSSPDKTTDACDRSQSGTTSGHSTGDHGLDLWMSSLAASLARTSAQPAKEPVSPENEADSGRKWRGSLAKYDPDSRSWKTHQFSLLGGLESYSETWPRWGMMRNGECWALTTSAPPIAETESGFLPTPVCYDATPGGPGNHYNGLGYMAKFEWQTPVADDAVERQKGKFNSQGEPKLSAQVMWPTPRASEGAKQPNDANRNSPCLSWVVREIHGGQTTHRMTLNPSWVEWLMGWPIGWTDLEPLETDKFQQWLNSHGKHSHKADEAVERMKSNGN